MTVLLQWVGNRAFGVSTGLENICSFVSSVPYFEKRRTDEKSHWRVPFMLGLVTAGAVSAFLSNGQWEWIASAGMLDTELALSDMGKAAWMFAGGILIGFGTRLAGGCTSGHGIYGLSTFQWPSLVATLSFMGSGMLTTWLIYRIL